MARILAVDYGIKRTGIAVTDESQTFAFGLETVSTNMLKGFLKTYLGKNDVEAIIVGLPRKMDSSDTDATPIVEDFVRRLGRDFPDLPVYRMDERFTSGMAKQAIRDSGIRKQGRKDKALVDMVSATIILQSWLEQRKFKNENKAN